MDEGAKFCPQCGNPTGETGAPNGVTEVASQPAKSTGMRDSAIVIGLVLVVSIAFFMFKPAAEKPLPPVQTNPMDFDHSQGHDSPDLENLPDDYDALIAIANGHMDQGNSPMAAEVYSRALGMDGSSPDVRTDYGACLHAMGLGDRALEEFRTVMEAHPGHAISRFNAGIVYYGMRQLDSAKVYFERYISMDPQGTASETARGILKEIGG